MWNSRKLKRQDWYMCRYFLIAFFTCSIAIATPTLAHNNYVPIQTQQQINLNDLITQGRMAYQAGKYAAATQIWQEAEQTPRQGVDRALIFNYLALSSQKQGNWQQAEEYIAKSLALFPEPANLTVKSLNIYAQALNTRGRLELEMGQAETALTTWKQAATVYQQAKDDTGRIGTQINQAQALQTMGLYRRAQKLLQQITVELNQQDDSTIKIAGLRSLGNALRVTGDLDLAQEVLQQSLTVSQELNLPEESSMTLFSLGNI
ncbi:MAG: tetratricopeptide repeat protein, partial [Cyanobacteria bacterium P01_C01_bin.72]